jgi:hypothetical protein
MFDHWYIQGRSIEDSDVAIIAVLGEESLEEVVMLQGCRFRVGNRPLRYVSISLNKIVLLS